MSYYHWGKYILDRVEKYQDKIAVRYKDEETNEWVGIRWGSFGARIQYMSRSLLECGVGVQEKVAIFSQNMPEWTITDLAIMSVRGVSVPIYPTNSTKEAKYIIQDADIKIVFVGEQEQYDRISDIIDSGVEIKQVVVYDKKTIIRDDNVSIYYRDFVQIGKESNLEDLYQSRMADAQLKDLATLIYTSGTTGEPKGVMLDHENLTSCLLSHDAELNLSDDEISLSFLPLSHVYERGWTFFCLHRGFEVYYLRDPKQVAQVMKEIKPTLMCTVPRLYEKIYALIQLKADEATGIKKKLMTWAFAIGEKKYNYYLMQGLKMPFFFNKKAQIAEKLVLGKIREAMGGRINFTPCGGGPLSPEILQFFHSIGVNIKMGYGLTETMATVVLYGDTHIDFKSTGKPLVGTQIKIGANDEIFVKGPGVMRGYYKKPEETAKVLGADGWFATGDAGRMDDEGNVFITDRIKDLMKTAGGKYIAPQKLEIAFSNDKFIEQIAIIGDCKKFVTALAVPAIEPLQEYAKQHNIRFSSIEDLVNNSQIKAFFEKRFEDIQKEFSRFEKVKRFTLLPKQFSMEAGEITSTLKLKRKVIQEKYKHLIDSMYKD